MAASNGKRQNTNPVQKQTTAINSKWLSNTLKSLGIAGTNVIKSMVPATSETIESMQKVATGAVQEVRQSRSGSKMLLNALSQNPAVKGANTIFRNALEDIKSGDLQGSGRNPFGDDSFSDIETAFGDMDAMFSNGEEDNSPDVAVQNVNMDSEAMAATLKAVNRNAEHQLNAMKAQNDTNVALTSATMLKMENIGASIISELNTINSNLAAIVEWNSTNMTKFIEASIGYYDQMAASLKTPESETNAKIGPNDIFGANGGLDLSNYFQYVKGNMDKADKTGIGSMVSMILENPNMLNVGTIVEMGMKTFVPKILETSMNRFDETLKDFIPTMLGRLADWGDRNDGPLAAAARVLGIRTKNQKEFDLSRVEKGPIPYNGIANQSITEIIPKYLRESNSYLKIIAQHLTGKSEEEMLSGSKMFDWKTGKNRTLTDIRNDVYGEVEEVGNSAFRNSAAGRTFKARRDMIEDENDRKSYDQMVENLFGLLRRYEDGPLDEKLKDKSVRESLIAKLAGSENGKNALSAVFDEIAGDGRLLGSIVASQKTSQVKTATHMNNVSGEASIHGLHQITDLSLDDWFDKKIGQYAAITGVQPSGGQPATPPNIPSIQTKEYFKTKIAQDRLTEQQLEEAYDENASLLERGGRAASKPFNALTKVMSGIMHGDADEAWDEFISGIGDMFKKAGDFLGEKFFTPIKNALFGERNKQGYMEGGLLKGVNNYTTEAFYSLRHMFTGEGYKKADGTDVPTMNDEEKKNTILGKLRSGANWFTEAIKVRLFGEKDKKTGKYEKEGLIPKAKDGIHKAADSLLSGLVGWKKALFGESENPDEDGKQILASIKEKAEKVAPDAIAGGIGGGLIGMLVGGPIGGALLGFAGGIAKNSKSFQKWLFGDEIVDEEGNTTRTGGVIDRKTQEFVRDHGKFLAGGAAIGALSGLTGFGILGTIAGGPVMGAALGLGTAIIAKTKTFQQFLFGNPEAGKMGLFGNMKNWIKRLGINSDGDVDGERTMGMAALGAAGGGILGAIMLHPVIGASLGLGAAIIAQKDNFHDWFFGKTDENGNRKEGILGQFKNMLHVNVFLPLKNNFVNIGRDFNTFLKDTFGKINLSLEPIGNAVFGAIGKITNGAVKSFNDISNFIREDFLGNLAEGARKILSPLTSAIGTVANALYGAGKAIVSAPINILYKLTSPVVAAAANVVGTVTSAAVKGIDMLIVKPINNLILKPLSGIVKIAGNVIAAPFKFIADVTQVITDKVSGVVTHISNFFYEMGKDIKKNVIDKFILAPVQHLGRFLGKIGQDIIDSILSPFKAVKEAVGGIFNKAGEMVTNGIKDFFSRLNPFNIITGLVRGGVNIFNRLRGKDSEPKEGGGYFTQLWRRTGVGYRGGSEDDIETDEKGRVIGRKTSNWRARRDHEHGIRQEREENKQARITDRDRLKNQQLIAKLTKNQRTDDTEESRAIAFEYYKQKHPLTDATVDTLFKGKAVDAEAHALEKKANEANVSTESWVHKIYTFLTTGDRAPRDIGKETGRGLADTQKARADARNTYRAEVAQATTWSDKKLAKEKRDAAIESSKKAEARILENYQNMVENATSMGDVLSAAKGELGTYFKKRKADRQSKKAEFERVHGKGIWNRIKGTFMDANGIIPGHAEGTDDSDEGPAAIGEAGEMELVTSPDRSINYLAGRHGAEIIDLEEGSTVTPISKIGNLSSLTNLSGSDGIIQVLLDIKETIQAPLRKLFGIAQSLVHIEEAETVENVPALVGSERLALPAADTITGNALGGKGSEEDLEDAAAQASVSNLTGHALRENLEQKKIQEEEAKTQAAQLATLQSLKEGQEHHNSVWDFIFSKKGLITGALLIGIPWLINKLKNFSFSFPSIAEIGEKILSNTTQALKNFWGWLSGNKDKESGDNPVDDGVNAALSLADVQTDSALDLVNPFTPLYHNKTDASGERVVNQTATGAKSQLLLWQPIKQDIMKPAYYGLELERATRDANLLTSQMSAAAAEGRIADAKNLASQATEAHKAKDLAQKDYDKAVGAQGTGFVQSVARNVGRVGILHAGSNLVGAGAKTIASNLGASEETSQKIGNVATAGTAAFLTYDTAKSALTGKTSLIDKILDGLKKMFDFLAKRLGQDKRLANVASKINGIFNTIYQNTVGKLTNAVATLVQKELAKHGINVSLNAATLGLGYVAGALSGLASGVCGVEHLFSISPGDADPLMYTISSILGAAFGALEMDPVIGWSVAMIRVLDTILVGTLGMGIKQFIAQNLYNLLKGDDGATLAEKQAAFDEQRTYYNETYGASLDTQTFNSMVNNGDWLDRVWRGKAQYDENGHLIFDEAGGQIDRGLKGMIVGGEKTYAKDSYGNIIQDASGKAVVARDAQGNVVKKKEKWGDKVGQFFNGAKRFFVGGDTYETDENGNAIWDTGSQSFKVANHENGLIQNAGTAIAKGASAAWKGVKDFGASVATGAQNLWKGAQDFGASVVTNVSNLGNNIKNGWDWLTKRTSATGWYDTDGSYYLSDGSHYTANGELMEKIDLPALSALITSGRLSEATDIITKEAGAIIMIKDAVNTVQTGFKNGVDALSKAANNAKEKAQAFVKNVGQNIAHGLTSFNNYFYEHQDDVWYTTDGNYYKVDGKNFILCNASGSVIGKPISAEEFDALLPTLTVGKKTVKAGITTSLEKFGASVSEGWDNFKTSAVTWADNFKKSASEGFKKTVEAAGRKLTDFNNFLFEHTDDVWYDTEGNYYKADGKNFVLCNAAGSVIGNPISAEEFQSLVPTLVSGKKTVKAGITTKLESIGKSVSDGWMNFTNKASEWFSGVKEKAGQVFTKAGTAIGNGLTAFNNFLYEHTEKRWYDTDGNYYQSNGSTFDYYNVNGDLLREGITSEEFGDICKSGVVTATDAQIVTVDSGIKQKLTGFSQKVADFFKIGADMKDQLFSIVGETAGSVAKSISDAGGPIKFIGGLFTKKKDTAYFDMNGNYYKLNSNGKYGYYNINGDLIEDDIDAEKVQDLITAGTVTAGEVQVDTAAQKAIKDIKSTVSKAWDKAKDTVKNGWDSFVSFITGGSGVSAKATAAMGGSGRGTTPTFVQGGSGEPTQYNGIPYFSQNDSRWAGRSYTRSDGVNDGATMANSGCGPAGMSMIINAVNGGHGLQGQTTDPVTLSRFAQASGDRDDTGTNWNFVNKAASAYGINSQQAMFPNQYDVVQGLQSGNPMLLSGQDDGSGNSPYTMAGHYIVATGITPNGYMTFNDPRGTQYSGKMPLNAVLDSTTSAWSFNSPMGGRGIKRNLNIKFRRGGRGTGVTSQDVVTVAMSQIGYLGKASNENLDDFYANPKKGYPAWTKYARDIGFTNNQHWCATFVTWVFWTAANKNKDIAKEVLCGAWSAGCSAYRNAARNAGRMIKPGQGEPQPGDLIIYDWPGEGGETDHIGIIVAVDKDYIQTVEGNTSKDQAAQYDGCVSTHKIKRGYSSIHCFCRPKYDDVSNFTGIDTSSNSSLLSSVGNAAVGTIDFLGKAATLFGGFIGKIFENLFTGNRTEDWGAYFDSLLGESGSLSGTMASIAASDLNLSQSESAKRIWTHLRNNGYSEYGASGLMGCWQNESGNLARRVEGDYITAFKNKYGGGDKDKAYQYVFADQANMDKYVEETLFPAYDKNYVPWSGSNVAKINENAYKYNGHRYPGIGLAQWTGGRSKRLADYAASINQNWGSLDTQLKFFEIESGERGLKGKLNAAPSPTEGARVALDNYEMGNNWSYTEKGQQQLRARAADAEAIYKQFKGQTFTEGGSGTGAETREYTATPIRTFIDTKPISETEGLRDVISATNGTDISRVEKLLGSVVDILGSSESADKIVKVLQEIRDKDPAHIVTTNNYSQNTTIEEGNRTVQVSSGGRGRMSTPTGNITRNERSARVIAYGQ